jgi:biopolymer transport protein ExbB
MSELLSVGGPLSWLLIGAFLLAAGIFFERMSYFHRATLNVEEFMSGVASLVRRKNYAEALHECLTVGVPVGRVMHAALLRHQATREELRQIVQEAGQLEVPKLEKHIHLVYAVAHAAPLCGLLGTTVSLLDSFSLLSQTGTVANPNQLAAGIYSSLTASAYGLAVAIPALLAYMALTSRVKHLLHDIEAAGVEIVNLLIDSRADKSILTFQAAAPAVQVATEVIAEPKVTKTSRSRTAKAQ